MDLTAHGPTRSLAYNRLEILSARFNLHILLNEAVEMKEARAVPHRDFYNIRKVCYCTSVTFAHTKELHASEFV